MRNVGYEISFESGFSDSNHSLNCPYSTSKDNQSLQLDCEMGHLLIALDFREQVHELARKVSLVIP